ncbi:hypothetical protein [Methylobacter luteus]|uniref:hypothetical protein n=1 Tax=Methylobacter luteus TaxID=415 RepID=UPI00041B7D74|nr:hypothetical protein [Methylobacter luteus]
MCENTEIDTSEYHQLPLANLKLSGNYEKLIKRIIGINGFNNLLGERFIAETVGDIVSLEPHKFSKCQGIGKLYVETLIEFKKELPHILNKLKQEPNFVFKEDIFTSTVDDYDFETPIYRLDLSPKYQKLIKKISSVMCNVETVQDIINIDADSFSKLPTIGKSYINSLITLQKDLLPLVSTQLDSDNKEIDVEIPSQSILSKLYVNYGYLSEKEIKQLKKIEKFYDGNIDIRNVNTILTIDKIELVKQAGFGKLFTNALNDLQNKIKNELSVLPKNITDHIIKQRCLFICSDITFLEFNEIDNILIEDIEGYLWTLDEMKMDIALSRWGFNKEHEILEEFGSRYNLTRQRVQQLEKSINKNLLLNFRIQPKVLWANIREKMTEDLTALLPNLAKCFETDKLFYAFMELCCQVESGSISRIIYTKINNKAINSLFCNNTSPIAQEIIINELMSNYGYSKASSINGIKNLEKDGRIEITEQGIYPKNLSKAEAVAHALVSHPEGLPWKDIVRIVNKKAYTSTPFDETKHIGSGFSDSEYIYLCAKGTYRSLLFLDIGQFNIPVIMQHLLDHFKLHQSNTVHLHDYYYQSKGNRSEIDYFTLRHLVREYGEEYGLYFSGKSNTDNVSLDQDVKSVTQANVIIKVLNESKVAMTMQEIAERLRSKSTAHGRYYIQNLIEEGKVVRVDQMVYTTPEKAFSNMDIKSVMRIILDIMNISNIIVEADVFREYVNIELNLSYSKYIYAGLVKTQINELAWYRNGNLFSKSPIPYKSLIDMCKQLCDPELPNNQNTKIIQKSAWLTDAVATEAIHQWRWQISH